MMFKLGSTFAVNFVLPKQYPDGYFKYWLPYAQIRNSNGDLVSTKTIAAWADISTTRNIIVGALDDTSVWKIDNVAYLDILLTSPTGISIYSKREVIRTALPCTKEIVIPSYTETDLVELGKIKEEILLELL